LGGAELSGLILIFEALGASIGGGLAIGLLLYSFIINFGYIVCFFKGHTKFYYVANTEYPNQHSFWCGRCGFESSDEVEAKKANVPLFYYQMMDKRYA
jgi:hypothetical protein